MPYKAFISYSHSADGDFADALHDAMEKLAKPWYARRARQVVLDKTAMAAGSSLGETIHKKLEESEWLVLLAAPGSAQSKWCDDEIDWWAEHKSMDNVVVALTDGDIAINGDSQHIDWENSTALSSHYRAAVGDEAVPLFEDLRPFKADLEHANLRNPRFRDEVAKVVGSIENKDPGELASEDQRQFTHAKRIRRAAEIGLVLLTVAAVALGIVAFFAAERARENEATAIENEERAEQEADRANTNADIAEENEAIAKENEQQALLEARRARSSALASQAIALSPEVPDAAALLALESLRVAPTVDAFISVVNSVVSNTHFVWRSSVPDKPIVSAAAWSADGSTVAVGTEFGDLLVYPPDSSAPTQLGLRGEEVVSIAFVDDTSVIRVLHWTGTLTTWDVRDGSLLEQVSLVDGIDSGRISSDGSTVVVLEQDDDGGVVTTFDGDGVELATIEPENPLAFCIFRCLAISGDGSEVAWGEEDSDTGFDVVAVWSGGSSTRQIFEPFGFLESMAYLPGGESMIVADDEDLAYLIDTNVSGLTVAEDATLVADAEFLTYAFAGPFEDAPVLMVSGHLDGSVGIWELDESEGTGVQLANLTRHNDEVHAVAVSPDGATLVSGSWDGDVISWRTEAAATSGQIHVDAHQGRINDVALIGAQPRVVSVADDGLVKFWDVRAGVELVETRSVDFTNELFADLQSVDASPGGDLIVVGATLYSVDEEGFVVFDDTLLVLDASSGVELGRIAMPELPTSVAFSEDGVWLAVGTSFSGIYVWDTNDLGGDPVHVLEGAASRSGGVAFSGDGSLLAAATFEGSVGLWDVASWAIAATIEPNQDGNVTAVALNDTGTLLAWGDDTRLISLFDVAQGARIGENLTGHTQPITDLTFSDIDGDGVDAVLTSTSEDGSTRVWEIEARRLVARIQAHVSDATAVDVSLDTNLMVTSSHDWSLWVGDLTPETWVAAACNLAGRNMAMEEWEALPGEEAYVRHCADVPAGIGAPGDAAAWTFVFEGVDVAAS